MKSFVFFAILSTMVVVALASSHSESPASSNNPVSDITDFYMFQSYESGRTGFTTFLANYIPRQPPFGGPNYYALDPNFYYNIYVDNTGEGRADITYQFNIANELSGARGIKIPVGKKQSVYVALKAVGPIQAGNNANLNFLEYYSLNVVEKSATNQSGFVTAANGGSSTFQKPYDYAGTKTFPNYAAYADQYVYDINLPGCSTAGKVFVGQRAESFSINIGKIFDLINLIPIDGAPPSSFPGGITNDPSNNVFRWLNIVTFALEVPTSCLVGSGNGVIGAWSASVAIQGNRQKSRLGNPLVNELLIGLPEKDKWNRRMPFQDGLLKKYISYPTFPAIVNSLFLTPVNSILGTKFATLAPTNYPRTDLEAIFLTGIPGINQLSFTPTEGVELMRLNTSIAATPIANQSFLGVLGNDLAGYPNGRRPGDDVIDITLRAAMGALCYLNGAPFCTPSQAVVGNVAFIDGAPIQASDFGSTFPYLNAPTPGSLNIL